MMNNLPTNEHQMTSSSPAAPPPLVLIRCSSSSNGSGSTKAAAENWILYFAGQEFLSLCSTMDKILLDEETTHKDVCKDICVYPPPHLGPSSRWPGSISSAQ